MEFNEEWGFVRAGLHRRDDLRGMDVYEIKALRFLEHGGAPSVLGIAGMHGVGNSSLLNLLDITYSNYHPFEHVFHVQAGSGCTVAGLQDCLAWIIGLGRCPDMSDAHNSPRSSPDVLNSKDFCWCWMMCATALISQLSACQCHLLGTGRKSSSPPGIRLSAPPWAARCSQHHPNAVLGRR